MGKLTNIEHHTTIQMSVQDHWSKDLNPEEFQFWKASTEDGHICETIEEFRYFKSEYDRGNSDTETGIAGDGSDGEDTDPVEEEEEQEEYDYGGEPDEYVNGRLVSGRTFEEQNRSRGRVSVSQVDDDYQKEEEPEEQPKRKFARTSFASSNSFRAPAPPQQTAARSAYPRTYDRNEHSGPAAQASTYGRSYVSYRYRPYKNAEFYPPRKQYDRYPRDWYGQDR